MKIMIIIYSNDTETVWNAFRFATTCLVHEDEVTVFLLGKGVEASSQSTISYDIDEQLQLYREHGGLLVGCGICCENRRDEMPYLAEVLNCEMGSMQQLYTLSIEADKVFTF